MSLSVIIPSRTASNLIACVEAVRRHEPEARIVVVDDTPDLSLAQVQDWMLAVTVAGARSRSSTREIATSEYGRSGPTT